jgi:hypothetical protein
LAKPASAPPVITTTSRTPSYAIAAACRAGGGGLFVTAAHVAPSNDHVSASTTPLCSPPNRLTRRRRAS